MAIYFAKILNPEDYGFIAMVIAFTVIYNYIIGQEFYVKLNRDLKFETKKQELLISQGFSYYTIVNFFGYSAILVACIFFYPWCNTTITIFLPLIIVTEHLALEIYRYQIIFEKQVEANLCQLIKNVWIYIVVGLYHCSINIDLSSVFLLWAASNLIGIITGFLLIRSSVNISVRYNTNIYYWFIDQFKKSYPYLLSSISIGGLYTIDKFYIDENLGLDYVAPYAFFLGIVNSIYSLVEAGVYNYSMPKLLSLRNGSDFKVEYKRMFRNSIYLSTIFSILAFCLLDDLLKYIGKSVYSDNSNLFYFFVIMLFVKVANSNAQYFLYAQSVDKYIYLSNIIAAPVFIILLFFNPATASLPAVAVFLIATLFISLIVKVIGMAKSNV